MALKPLRLTAFCKTAIWGGEKLKTGYGKVTDVSPLAETWELSVREKENSIVSGGEYDGLTLKAAIEKMGYASVSPDYDGENFPLLIKFIDAAAPLSVQVHPNDAYAAAFGAPGKTEMWIIVEAEPGASLLYGLKDGMTASDLKSAVEEKDTLRVLNEVPVKPGEVYYIPAGMAHAIGEGIVLCEVQQNCDLTYRLFDYNRIGADGKPRELHIAKALDVTRPFTREEVEKEQFLRSPATDNLLADTPYFRTERYATAKENAVLPKRSSFVSVICVSGNGTLTSAGEVLDASRGNSFFIPAGCEPVTLSGDAVWISASANKI